MTVAGSTAVLYRSSTAKDARCNHVAFVDLDTGQRLWDARFPATRADRLGGAPSVTLTRDTVALAWGSGTGAYDMKTGDRLWSSIRRDDCRDMGLTGGGGLLIRNDCYDNKSTTTSFRVRKVDPRTGAVKWTYEVARGVFDVSLLSAEPPVLAISAGEVDITDLISLDQHGKYRATIRLKSGTYAAKCMIPDEVSGAIDDCPNVVVGDGQVFLMSRDDPDATIEKNSNWIIGFDLATGKTTKKFDSGSNERLYPIRMSGDQLIAFRESSDAIRPYGVVSLNPRTGRETPYFYFGLPSEAASMTGTEVTDTLVQNGRIFFGVKVATGPESGKTKSWEWLVLGVGAK